MNVLAVIEPGSALTDSQVQSGGSFDIDYVVYGPTQKIILDGTKERQGDFVFTANEIGEYKFCFSNDMSTFAEKMVDFEIAVSANTPAPSQSRPYPGNQHHHHRLFLTSIIG